MSELALPADSLSSVLGHQKTAKETDNGQGRRGRGHRPGCQDVMQLDSQA